MSTISSKCCSTPPVVIKDYQPKGEYKLFEGLNTYVTGPPNATKAILLVGDIFGFSTQLLQGADLLTRNKYLVVYPDFFNDSPAQASWMEGTFEGVPPKIMEFIMTTGNPATALSRIPSFLSAVTAEKNIASWGAVGLCWGGKIVSLYCGIDGGATVKVAAQAHPAMLDPEDAVKISVPFATLASVDEVKEHVDAFVAGLKGEKFVETFGDMNHGWMAARGDLTDEKGREEYARGYKILGDWFEKYL